MLYFKPSNLHFYHGILDTEQRNQNLLYSKKDLKLLKHYYTFPNSPKTDLILMQPEYYPEMLAERFIRKNYLSAQERAQYRIFIVNDVFIDDFNKRLDGEYIYGLLPDHRLYIAPIHEVRNHSYLIAGLPVIAIGHAYINNGYLMTLSNNSGHYKPPLSKMKPGIEWFIKNISHDFLIEDHSTMSPEMSHYEAKIYLASALYVMPLQALERKDVELFLHHLCTVVVPEKSKETEEDNEEDNLLAHHTVISSLTSTGYENLIPNSQRNLNSMDVCASLGKENTNNGAIEPSLIQRFTSIQRSIEYYRFNGIKKSWRAT